MYTISRRQREHPVKRPQLSGVALLLGTYTEAHRTRRKRETDHADDNRRRTASDARRSGLGLRPRASRAGIHDRALARQPSLEEIASTSDCRNRISTISSGRFSGITPKAFLQAITLDHAKALLKDSASLLDATYEVGLSGPGRLHDLFVTHEAMSPGEWKAGGEGLVLRYGFALPLRRGAGRADRPRSRRPRLGRRQGGCGRAADTGKPAGGRTGALADMMRRWPKARFVEDQPAGRTHRRPHLRARQWQSDQPLRVVMLGSISRSGLAGAAPHPDGPRATYGDVACHIGKPTAARAVGAAWGATDQLRGALPSRARPLRRPDRLFTGASRASRRSSAGRRAASDRRRAADGLNRLASALLQPVAEVAKQTGFVW